MEEEEKKAEEVNCVQLLFCGTTAWDAISRQRSLPEENLENGQLRHSENFREDIGLKLDLADGVNNFDEDMDLLGFGDADSEERLSDISDSVLSMATETDGSIGSVVEYTLFPETSKSTAETTEKPKVPAKLPRPPQKQTQAGSSRTSASKSSYKPSTAIRPSAEFDMRRPSNGGMQPPSNTLTHNSFSSHSEPKTVAACILIPSDPERRRDTRTGTA